MLCWVFVAGSICISHVPRGISPIELAQCSQWGNAEGTFTDCEIRNTTASYKVAANAMILIRCTFIDCGSTTDGGVIQHNCEKNITMDECNFIRCFGAFGGVVRTNAGYMVMNNCYSEDCYGSGNGGFANCNNGGVDISACEFKGIKGANGAAICLWYGIGTSVLTVQTSLFKSCHSTNLGVFYVHSSCPNPVSITYSRFVDCKADNNGAAIYYLSPTTLTLNTCLIENCEAKSKGYVLYTGPNAVLSYKYLCIKTYGETSVYTVNGTFVYESGACAVADARWPPTAQFTTVMTLPRYKISLILTQLCATFMYVI